MKIFLSAILMSLLAISGCKMRDSSFAKHAFGETSRDIDSVDFIECQLSYQSTKYFPQTQKYLQSIFMKLASANPQTFRVGSKLDPKRFCIQVVDKGEINAFARPLERSINVHIPMVMVMESDAAMAAVMSHEMAHVALLHNDAQHPALAPTAESVALIKENATIYRKYSEKSNQMERIRDEVLTLLEKIGDDDSTRRAQEDFFKLFDAIFYTIGHAQNPSLSMFANQRNTLLRNIHPDLAEQVRPRIDALAKVALEIQPISAQMDKLHTKLRNNLMKADGVEIPEGMNWKEQEADEIGFEFYRRAGFKDTAYFDIFKMFISSGGREISEIMDCMQKSFRAVMMNDPDYEPSRGMNSHPESCWRIYDHQRELVFHQKDYAQFPNDLIIMDPAGLANARAEIEEFFRNRPKSTEQGVNESITPIGGETERAPPPQIYPRK